MMAPDFISAHREKDAYRGCAGLQAVYVRSAQLTNQDRRRKTEAALMAAGAVLKASGTRLTAASLARQAGISRQALYAHHRALLNELLGVNHGRSAG